MHPVVETNCYFIRLEMGSIISIPGLQTYMIFCWKFSVAEPALLVFLVQISYKMGGGGEKTQTPQFSLQICD